MEVNAVPPKEVIRGIELLNSINSGEIDNPNLQERRKNIYEVYGNGYIWDLK